MASLAKGELISCLQNALESGKHNFFRRTENIYQLEDISKTVKEMKMLVEFVVDANYGELSQRGKHDLIAAWPILERIMNWISKSILRRLSPRMSTVHPWMICFDVTMAQEVFDVLKKRVLNITSYGLQVEETEKKCICRFMNLRRFVSVFKKFDSHFSRYKKELKGGGFVDLIIDEEQQGVLIYKKNEEKLDISLHYGCWNDFGLRQH